METIVEICCGSYEDAIASYQGGAKRIELNSALFMGGLTPSLASLIRTKADTNLKVICMVRPRAAGFIYEKSEKDTMMQDAKLFLENGADGIAFGFLDENCEIQKEYTKDMVELIHSYQKEAVFHRAFDCVNDPMVSMEQLIELGVDRVLTSGLQGKAMEGIQLIKALQQKYGSQIEILAGSGMNKTNAKAMIETTGIHQVHSSCKSWKKDISTTRNGVSYGYADEPNNTSYDVVDVELVKGIVASVK